MVGANRRSAIREDREAVVHRLSDYPASQLARDKRIYMLLHDLVEAQVAESGQEMTVQDLLLRIAFPGVRASEVCNACSTATATSPRFWPAAE
jgi:hypothetical protein